MLNLFLLFTNTFLALLFFLAGLIPQLLQKSQKTLKIAVEKGAAGRQAELLARQAAALMEQTARGEFTISAAVEAIRSEGRAMGAFDPQAGAKTESNRRRAKQIAYNLEHGVVPRRAKKSGTGSALLAEHTTSDDTIQPALYNAPDNASQGVAETMAGYTTTPTANAPQGSIESLIEEARTAMEDAAKSLDFVAAAKHRDRMRELQKLAEK